MNAIFLDTVGLLALWDESDQWHHDAEEAFARVREARSRVLTTTFILLECGNAAARRPYRLTVDRLRERLQADATLVAPEHDDWLQAWEAYCSAGIGGAGIVDHVSFTVMRRLGLRHVFTNDHHFREAGFETLF